MGFMGFDELLNATGGKLLFGRPAEVKGFSIDSRTIKEEELFIAIKGARFDGHDFLGEALRKGCGALVSVPPADPPMGKVVVHVQNTTRALHDIARYLRMKNHIKVVGITGTNGKTTTKEMAASILGTRFRVLKNTGNLNNQIGLPLSLLRREEGHEAAVLEMGASAPGDIRELCAIAVPDFAVLTNIGHAHIEGFMDIASIRRTKLEIVESVGTAIANADDTYLMEGLKGFGGRLVSYGIGGSPDVLATGVELKDRSSSFTLSMRGEASRVTLKVTGRFNVQNALAASAVGLVFDMDIGFVKQGLESFEGVPMRLEIKELCGALVISDVYNANPSSMEEAVRELVRLRRKRAIAVLGDMLELGSYADTAHRRLGKWMASLPVDRFIAVGPNMAVAAEEFSRHRGTAIVVRSANEARAVLVENYRQDDTILVKGSRGMRMEDVFGPGETVCGGKVESGGPGSGGGGKFLDATGSYVI